MGRLGLRVACAYAALLLLGPVSDPHAHDPYHAHVVLGAGSLAAAGSRSHSHGPGVVSLRAGELASAVLHVGVCPPAAAPAVSLPPASGAERAPAPAPVRSRPAFLDPPTPPPRTA